MTKFTYRALQVIIDDSNKWIITDEAIREEYEIEADSDSQAIVAGNEKLYKDHPDISINWFLTGASES